jgi:RNA polymerase sigma-70 factor (ECF subfamily)
MRWLRAQGVPDWDTEDVAQEVFAVVHRKLEQFDGANLAGWIYGICKRTASQYRRRVWFRHTVLRHHGFSLETVQDPHGGPAATLATKERYRLVWCILSKMSAKQRTAFVLFEVEGYSGDEIAKLEQIPTKTVWSRLARARKQFVELERQLTVADQEGVLK